jgi:carbamoyltransferase
MEKRMLTLGINAAFHDSSAALLKDGVLIAAAEEERFTRVKHAKRPIPFSAYELPFHAIDYCLKIAGASITDVDNFAYGYDPSIQRATLSNPRALTLPLEPSEHRREHDFETPWTPLFLSHVINAPRHLAAGFPHHLQSRLKGLPPEGPRSFHFVEHHIAHAASAFLCSPFEESAVMVLDGRGELATTSYYLGMNNHLRKLGEVRMPHSLGLLYEEVTTHLGFLHSSDEYKVMALAALGRPTFVEFFQEIIDLRGEGSYTIRKHSLTEALGPARVRGTEITQRHHDIAHSLQRVLEERVLEISRWLRHASGSRRLCMAGGVALNCVMNSRVRDEGPFDDVWIQPAAGDAGTALGAALWLDAHIRNSHERPFLMEHAYWGPGYSDREIEAFLIWSKQPYRALSTPAEEVAALLEQDKVIGWMQGRMEFGPRALGARSILASPLHASMQQRLNNIKDREDFRPVAPVVLAEKASEWFTPVGPSPFMLFVNDVLPEQRHLVPAICHADATARLQTIRREHNPQYYDVIAAFERATGVPILVNTSFNSRGEPVVCSPQDAVECFWSSPLDALVIGNFVIEKRPV